MSILTAFCMRKAAPFQLYSVRSMQDTDSFYKKQQAAFNAEKS